VKKSGAQCQLSHEKGGWRGTKGSEQRASQEHGEKGPKRGEVKETAESVNYLGAAVLTYPTQRLYKRKYGLPLDYLF